jgi:hypothetical protein
VKGQSGNRQGRPKGVPNRITRQIRELARALTTGNEAYLENLRRRLETGQCQPAIETLMLHYAYGKPAEMTKFEGAVPFAMIFPGPRYDPLAEAPPPAEVRGAR